MKKLLFILLFAIFLPSIPKASAEVSLSFFYDSLEDDGDWFEADDYGYCWQPRGVSADWSPYSDGYWTYTDVGWTWVSYEPFGWATYHYGRWANLRGRGWVWTPGYEWGPAWVSWRSSDDYIGWAPLPPRAVCRPGITISAWVDSYYDIGPSYYNFTSCRRFGSPSIRQVLVDRSENVTIINRTTNITNISYQNNVVYNGGPDYDRINRRSDRQIERLKLDRVARFDDRRDPRFSRKENGRLAVVAPTVVPVEEKLRPRNIRANLGKVNAEKGWESIRDPKVAEQTRQKIRGENKDRVPAEVENNGQQSVSQSLRSEARIKTVKASQVSAEPALTKPKQRSSNEARKVDPVEATQPVKGGGSKNRAADIINEPPARQKSQERPSGSDSKPANVTKELQERPKNRPSDQEIVPAEAKRRDPDAENGLKSYRKPPVTQPSVNQEQDLQEAVRQQRKNEAREQAARQARKDESAREEQQVKRQRSESNVREREEAIRQTEARERSTRQAQQAAEQENRARAQRQQSVQQQKEQQFRQQQAAQQQARPVQKEKARRGAVEEGQPKKRKGDKKEEKEDE